MTDMIGQIQQTEETPQVTEQESKRGRPTKLTPEIQDKIVEAISGGNYKEIAAEWAGIAPDTLGRWLSRAREPYLTFRRAVLEAERTAEIRCVALIMKAAGEDAKHAEWLLERKHHERWGRKDRHEVTGANGGPIDARVVFYLPEPTRRVAVLEAPPSRALPPAGHEGNGDGPGAPREGVQ
ncbi:MAG: hypothetical protein Q8R92_08505 [Deltaproteobacteria bacterium]|nr:hypothetical protein [Deltaproteobacteria bacterium]